MYKCDHCEAYFLDIHAKCEHMKQHHGCSYIITTRGVKYGLPRTQRC